MPRRNPDLRKPLPRFGVQGCLGTRGTSAVRAYYTTTAAGEAKVVVAWSERDVHAAKTEPLERRQRSWDDTPAHREEARVFGKAVHERLERIAAGLPAVVAPPPRPHTVHECWEAFRAAEFDHLRQRSRDLYAQRWDKFALFVGPTKLANEVTLGTLDSFRNALRQQDYAIEQIRRIVADVRMVFRFAVRRDLIQPTKVTDYRVKRAKEDVVIAITEYTPEEARKLLGAFDPRDPRQWRPYVATWLLALAGPRQHQALSLEWRDLDLVRGVIHWRPELDKQGRERWQPVPAAVIEAFLVAYGWRTAYEYTGPYVLFGAGRGTREYRGQRHRRQHGRWVTTAKQAARAAALVDQPYTYGAYNTALHAAETRAGVAPQAYRAAHGFRRLVVGNLLQATGNLVAAGAYVGDVDLATLRRAYVKERPSDIQHLAELAQSHLLGGARGPAVTWGGAPAAAGEVSGDA